MSKLSFDALAERADQVATEDLLNSINGGTENDCHPKEEEKEEEKPCGDCVNAMTRTQGSLQHSAYAFIHWISH